MRTSDIQTLFDYNYWATERIIAATARLDPQQLVAPAAVPSGSLRGTLVHILQVEQIWRARCQGGPPVPGLREIDFPTVSTLAARWREDEAAWRAYLGKLADADLERQVVYGTLTKGTFAHPLWHLLAHVVTHGTQHRSEAAIILTGFEQSPGDIDLIFFSREIGTPPLARIA